MTTRYSAPSVEAIQEDSSEDEVRGDLRGNDEEPNNETPLRFPRPSHDPAMSPMKANTGREREREREKERERSRRSHKTTTTSTRHTSKSKSKNISAKRASAPPPTRDNGSDSSRSRHRRQSNRSTNSASSSSDEEEPVQDHRAVLAVARARLTSPSTLSSLTSLTTTTNKSSGSSGSNSTVTQASVTKRPSIVKKTDVPESPMSPAVPDAPDVFAFLDKEGSPEDEDQNEEVHDPDETPQWMPGQLEDDEEEDSLPPNTSQEHAVASSSASSSFHEDDNFSDPLADNDTDRSTSPERSVHGQEEDNEPPPPAPTDETSTKVASQMAAAQQRQNLYESMHSFGTPNMPRGQAKHPHIPSTALSPRYQPQVKQRALPRADKLPVTGYELLASRLSSHSSSVDTEKGQRIKPMYRKFEALNHRLLLHLQDEISELEEQLHRLDNADTQSRRTDRHIVPASRRAAVAAGGELQWHKADILGRIGYKLAQYNQALSSFNTTQSLSPPNPRDISTYRDYLQTAHPIAEAETRFLDPADDLVSIYSDHIPPSSSYSASCESSSSSYPPSTVQTQIKLPSEETVPEEPQTKASVLPALAVALAVAILVPILTFSVIPGFVGRITVASLVAGGVLSATIQAGVVESGLVLRSEGIMCAGVYGGVMVVVAGVMPG